MNFAGRTVLITGAGGNLGKAVADAFLAAGARLALLDHRMESLDKAFPDLAPHHRKWAVDLTDEAAVAAIAAALEGEGGVYAVVATAGGFHAGEDVHQTDAAAWNRMMDRNVTTFLNTVRPVIPGMIARGSGKIVAIGANGALKGAPHMAAYTASKSVVMRLTESMGAELRGHGINVNAILPSTLDTPDNRAGMPKADPSKWVRLEDAAAVILFLCSDGARALNGALIPVVGLA